MRLPGTRSGAWGLENNLSPRSMRRSRGQWSIRSSTRWFLAMCGVPCLGAFPSRCTSASAATCRLSLPYFTDGAIRQSGSVQPDFPLQPTAPSLRSGDCGRASLGAACACRCPMRWRGRCSPSSRARLPAASTPRSCAACGRCWSCSAAGRPCRRALRRWSRLGARGRASTCMCIRSPAGWRTSGWPRCWPPAPGPGLGPHAAGHLQHRRQRLRIRTGDRHRHRLARGVAPGAPASLADDDLLPDALASLNAGELAARRLREIARVGGRVFRGHPGQPKATRELRASAKPDPRGAAPPRRRQPAARAGRARGARAGARSGAPAPARLCRARNEARRAGRRRCRRRQAVAACARSR